jgi:hypothetical protein
MGTNYYLEPPPCPHCGRGDEPLHIGKSSAGWCFSLRVYPEKGINDLPDWEKLFADPNLKIKDEYGDLVAKEEMLHTIKDRFWVSGGNSWGEKELRENHAVRGPNGLARHRIEPNYCSGHGEGTWDLCPYEFS